MLLATDYQLAPGACWLCGAAKRYDGEVIIDTQHEAGAFADRAGRVYICSACADTIGGLAGMVSGETHERTAELCKTLGRNLADATFRAERLAEAVESLRAAGYEAPAPDVFACGDCGESFDTRRSLGQHRRVHTDKPEPRNPDPVPDIPPVPDLPVPESFSDVVNA